MRLLNLDQLLRSQNLQLVEAASPDALASRGESLIWQDHVGPLVISRIDCNDRAAFRLRLGDEISVDVVGDRLAVRPAAHVPQSTIDHFLADQILPRVLSHRGELIVHAGAVRDADQAILLLGPSGTGKSTLASSFRQSGWSLMGDDAIILGFEEDAITARAVYPSLRLFADSIKGLFATAVTSHAMAHYSSKHRIDVAHGAEDSGPVALKAMFVLAGDQPITIDRLTVAQACMAVVENSFALDPTDRDRARQRLERASTLAEAIPAYSLTYPRDFDHLADVREAIQSAVADAQPLAL